VYQYTRTPVYLYLSVSFIQMLKAGVLVICGKAPTQNCLTMLNLRRAPASVERNVIASVWILRLSLIDFVLFHSFWFAPYYTEIVAYQRVNTGRLPNDTHVRLRSLIGGLEKLHEQTVLGVVILTIGTVMAAYGEIEFKVGQRRLTLVPGLLAKYVE